MSRVHYPIDIDGVFIGVADINQNVSISTFLLEMPYNPNRWHKHNYNIYVSSVQILDSDFKPISEEVILGSSVTIRGEDNMVLNYCNSSILAYKLLSDEEISELKKLGKNEGCKILRDGDDLIKKSFW